MLSGSLRVLERGMVSIGDRGRQGIVILHGHCDKLLVIGFIESRIFHGEYSIELPFDLVVIWRLIGHDSDTIVGQAGKDAKELMQLY